MPGDVPPDVNDRPLPLSLIFRVSAGTEGEEDKIWQANLKTYRELSAKKTPDKKKFALAMANLAIAGIDTERFAEALQLFKEAEQQNRLPAEAKPYYAELIEYAFNQEQYRPGQTNPDEVSGTQVLQKALDLYVQAYNDESQKNPVDGKLLFDIVSNIPDLLVRLNKAGERGAWLNKMLNIPALAEKQKAQIYYTLGVYGWQASYQISLPYTLKKLKVPDSAAVRMRVEIQRGFEYMFKTLSLDPSFIMPTSM